jgi:hypothetical protein
MKLWKAVLKKNSWIDNYYTYINLNSGPGIYPGYGDLCSPLSFLKLAKFNEIPYKAYFIEKDIKRVNILKKI